MDQRKLDAPVELFADQTELPKKTRNLLFRYCEVRPNPLKTVGDFLRAGKESFLNYSGVGFATICDVEDSLKANDLWWDGLDQLFIPPRHVRS